MVTNRIGLLLWVIARSRSLEYERALIVGVYDEMA